MMKIEFLDVWNKNRRREENDGLNKLFYSWSNPLTGHIASIKPNS